LSGIYILDACALIALLAGESGAENVKKLIQDAINGDITVKINQINLLEVYYKLCNVYNQNEANRTIKKIKQYPPGKREYSSSKHLKNSIFSRLSISYLLFLGKRVFCTNR